MKLPTILLLIAIEIIVLRIFWIGALERIDKRVDETVDEYLKVIKEVVKNTISRS